MRVAGLQLESGKAGDAQSLQNLTKKKDEEQDSVPSMDDIESAIAIKQAAKAKEEKKDAELAAKGGVPQDTVTMLLISYHNIGWELACLGKPDEAAPWYTKALEIARVHLGEDAPLTTRLANLSSGETVQEIAEQDAAPVHDPNWSEVKQAGQATYYYNKETKKSVWEKPADYNPPPKSHNPDWKEVSTPGQATYYFNATTGKSVWEKPEDFNPDIVMTSVTAKDEIGGMEVTQFTATMDLNLNPEEEKQRKLIWGGQQKPEGAEDKIYNWSMWGGMTPRSQALQDKNAALCDTLMDACVMGKEQQEKPITAGRRALLGTPDSRRRLSQLVKQQVRKKGLNTPDPFKALSRTGSPLLGAQPRAKSAAALFSAAASFDELNLTEANGLQKLSRRESQELLGAGSPSRLLLNTIGDQDRRLGRRPRSTQDLRPLKANKSIEQDMPPVSEVEGKHDAFQFFLSLPSLLSDIPCVV